MRSIFESITNKVNSVRGVGEAVHQATNAFQSMTNGDIPHGGMMGNPQTARGKSSYMPENDDDEPFDDDEYGDNSAYANQPQLRIVTNELQHTFERKAKLKYAIISGKLKDKNNWRRLIATLVVEDKDDKEIAKKYKDYDDDDISNLDKTIQRIIRNQNHLKKINSIKIEPEIEEQCIEFFVMEFVDDYMAGREPDFSGINAVELMYSKFTEPYNALIADLAIDYGLELKPKAIEFFKKVYIKVLGKQVDELTGETPPLAVDQPMAELVEETPPIVMPESAAILVPESNIIPLPRTQLKPMLRRWGVNPIEFPTLEVDYFEEFLASKGMDYDDIVYDEATLFDSAEAKLTFLKEFDKFAEIRAKAELENEEPDDEPDDDDDDENE